MTRSTRFRLLYGGEATGSFFAIDNFEVLESAGSAGEHILPQIPTLALVSLFLSPSTFRQALSAFGIAN